MKLEYTVQVWREDGQFVAHAMPIDVASCGDTPETAREAVDEAVKAFLTTAAAHGTLSEVLQDAGYRQIRGKWKRPDWSGIEQRSVVAGV